MTEPCHCGEPSVSECPCCTQRVCVEHLIQASKALGAAVGLDFREKGDFAEALEAEERVRLERQARSKAMSKHFDERWKKRKPITLPHERDGGTWKY